MIRALAMLSYVYQSATALVLIVCLSHLLPAEVYITVSLVLASAQLAGVLAFEWIQLAGVRYLASATQETAARLRVSLFLADLLGAAALTVAALALAVLLHLSPATLPGDLGSGGSLVLLGLGIAVAQGLTDLALSMVRVGGRLGRAAALMLLRASALLVGTVAGAWLEGSARGALAGHLAGHAASLVLLLATHAYLLRGASWRLRGADLARFSRYGMPAAAASVTHLTVPVAIRYLVVGWSAGDPGVAAAASLALDLLQRPFSVLVAAIHVVHYPEVVAAHDRAAPPAARAATAHLLAFILCASAIMLGGLIAFLPEAGHLLVKAGWQADFVRVGAGATVFFFLHTQIQTTLAVVPQLQEHTARLIAVAAGQLAAVAILVLAGVRLGASPRDALLLAAVGTALACLCAAGPTLAYGAVPKGRVVGASVLGAALIGATALHTDAGLVWLGARIALSAGIVAGVAWAGDFLQVRGERPGSGDTRPPVPAMASPPGRRGQPTARMSRSRRAERSQA